MLRDNDALALRIETIAARTAHHLHNIEWRQLNPAPLLRRVHLCPLDDHRVSGKVYSPRQRSCGNENLHVFVSKKIFHQGPVRARKSRMMHCESVLDQVLQIRVLGCLLALFSQNLLGCGVIPHKLTQTVIFQRHITQCFGGFDCLCTTVNKYEYLIAPCVLQSLLIADFVHQLKAFEGFLLSNSNVLLLQRHRAEAVVEEEKTSFRVHTKKGSNILEVWQGG